MRLSKIKLAGFKSFVDPTTITFPGNRVGIVGPNGCGKSNVIDAIRWVMGESSAKHLRGDSMADVIFNGSSSRKPVGTATIELFFDNSDGAIGGQYAQYAEVCIRRSVERDGLSQYYLNGVKCRRKDITGIFLGTGLGSRSYAIIEQGMISRLIEAKPEEMRVYIEEAAGISKYKARRRETENRIRHTKDNLDRLNDLREEVDKHIKHLQRQARQAERYKEHKQEQRTLEAELLVVRMNDLQASMDGHQLRLSQGQTRLEAAVAEQRGIEAKIEAARETHIAVSDSFNSTQGRYYGVQGEISRLEQAIKHSRELRERRDEDIAQSLAQLDEVDQEIDQDKTQLSTLEQNLAQLEPDLKQARAAAQTSAENLQRVESALDTWQSAWHDFTLENKEHQEVSNVEQTRIEQLEARLARLSEQQTQLASEQETISLVELESTVVGQTAHEVEAREAVRAVAHELEEIDRQMVQQRSQEHAVGEQLETTRAELESRRGRIETLEAVQKAALSDDEETASKWASREKIADQPRLAQQLAVTKPWERAVETVLGDFLQAICVPRNADHLRSLPASRVSLIDQAATEAEGQPDGTLLAHVRNAGSAASILKRVRVAASLDAALALRDSLPNGETVITADGVWLGPGWVRVNRGQRKADGVISREQDIRELRVEIRDLEVKVTRFESERQAARDEIERLEAVRTAKSVDSHEVNRRFAEVSANLGGMRQEYERAAARLGALDSDSQAVRNEIESINQALRDSRAKLDQSTDGLDRLEKRRPALQQQREQLEQEFDAAKEAAAADRSNVERVTIEFESRRASKESADTALRRINSQREQLMSRIEQLRGQVGDGDAPIADMQTELEEQLQLEVSVEKEMAEQRRKLEDAETELRNQESRRTDSEQAVTAAREEADQLRMQVREIEVRREGIAEQFSQSGLDLEQVKAELPEDASFDAWEDKLGQVRRRIDRLGAINLAAIEEFTEQSERKTYLDAQYEDLTAALDTLEGAIRKIDRETKQRFQQTFDKVNSGMQRLFPRLFGGGHAYLSLDGDDLLSAGVTVMAQPPGKRNSHIHLLSGGEKALTAVALVFSIFELNPAPFCLLDEVDAPLDDANVSRFCEIVREMSEAVQFLVITHNKTTMEMVSQLTGVTMNEPGVSRLVSVDIDEAVQLVAS